MIVNVRDVPRTTVVDVLVKFEYTEAFDVLLNPQTTLRMYSNDVVAFAVVVVAEQ